MSGGEVSFGVSVSEAPCTLLVRGVCPELAGELVVIGLFWAVPTEALAEVGLVLTS